jgi:uncharacterized protein
VPRLISRPCSLTHLRLKPIIRSRDTTAQASLHCDTSPYKLEIMIRLIMWVALIAAAVWFIRRLLNPPAKRPRAAPRESVAAPMVRCAHCGVHLPQDHALGQGQQWFCSEAHRLEGPTPPKR